MKILITGGKGNIATIIKDSLYQDYDITYPSHTELDLLDIQHLSNYLKEHQFDILIHTAICGGRRTREDESIDVYKNLLMFENLMKFSENFKMIINMDSGAIYDRSTDIYKRKEYELFTIPTDYYGFSKYLIYKRSESIPHIFNFRIFNIFHENEEPTRFIKSCFNAKKTNTDITIYHDKYFDFVYKDDFIIILKHYLSNSEQTSLQKTINICYDEKYKLSEIAKIIMGHNEDTKTNINILNKNCTHNYCGDNSCLKTMNIQLSSFERSIESYFDRNKFIQINYTF